MGSALPLLARNQFFQRLLELSPRPLSPHALEALYAHFLELRRWNVVHSLIGPGTVDQVLERHYGESLAALPVLPDGPARLLDVGSGAGFPGFVLAAAHPELEAFLLEARQKKWAFLSATARQTAVPCPCIHGRITAPLPAGLPNQIDCITVRAVRLSIRELEALTGLLSPGGCILLWSGARSPRLPPTLVVRESHRLAGSAQRKILVLQQALCRQQ